MIPSFLMLAVSNKVNPVNVFFPLSSLNLDAFIQHRHLDDDRRFENPTRTTIPIQVFAGLAYERSFLPTCIGLPSTSVPSLSLVIDCRPRYSIRNNPAISSFFRARLRYIYDNPNDLLYLLTQSCRLWLETELSPSTVSRFESDSRYSNLKHSCAFKFHS